MTPPRAARSPASYRRNPAATEPERRPGAAPNSPGNHVPDTEENKATAPSGGQGANSQQYAASKIEIALDLSRYHQKTNTTKLTKTQQNNMEMTERPTSVRLPLDPRN